MPKDEPANPFHNFKLAGFLGAVLSVALQPEKPRSLSACGHCSLFADGDNFGFRTEDGILLLPLPEANVLREQEGDPAQDGGGGARKRRRKWLGRCMSVVHQLHTLTAQRCLKVQARILRISSRECGDARALVLVDVYLPIEAWCGWQFPKSGAVAASLFKHVSCNWEARSSLLASNQNNQDRHADEDFWTISDCHVLGCEIHNTPGFSGKRLFDLHEIFKSLPSAWRDERQQPTRIKCGIAYPSPGISDLADDVLYKVLSLLGPRDLVRVAATCHHLRCLASSIIPCMKLKLFPHQEAAVEWMLKRERKPAFMSQPLFMSFSTVDGFSFYVNIVSGEISTEVAPTISDFRGGMFCDEPGLGKTVTALSLILKTHGILADPPDGVDVRWFNDKLDRRCGYYDLGPDKLTTTYLLSTWKRFMNRNGQTGKVCSSKLTPELESTAAAKPALQKRGRSLHCEIFDAPEASSDMKLGDPSCTSAYSTPQKCAVRSTRSLSRVRRDILDSYEENAAGDRKRNIIEKVNNSAHTTNVTKTRPTAHHNALLTSSSNKKSKKNNIPDSSVTWVQCDACRKWRKLTDRRNVDTTAAWFCIMNDDSLHQNCAVPEESWDCKGRITYLPGFYTKGSKPGTEENVSFFTSVLKEHLMLLDFETKKALTWLANLSQDKLLEMETVGITRADLDFLTISGKQCHAYHEIFQAFGLVGKAHGRNVWWYYPCFLENLVFDSTALKVALTKPLDMCRLYLSGATLIVVPANLVGHWKMQIEKHVRPGQLRVYVWNDNKKPCAHNLAWDYDVVITTFNRFSAEWSLHKKSVLMQVHWLRIILDEGHTLGSSLSMTNKLQMSVSLPASSRWILTGTPAPNTPNSQVSQLHPMLKFLHEEAYGQNQKSWETGILRPFESNMAEGRTRLLQLLERIMISARKADLKNIPPCIKKVTFLDFNAEHAKSYNELVLTVRRNILMADWNDPSHVESLLNPKQWKFRSSTIKNVRLSCCVAGHIKVSDAGQDIQETMDILVQQGLDPLLEDDYNIIKNALLDGCRCFRCNDWCRLPVITPCRHLLCLDCVALDSKKCTYPGCNNPYEMQSPEVLTRPENPSPKWPVPKDLIELQPSYKQDNWDPDWESTSSSKVAYLIKKLKDLLGSHTQMHCTLDGVNNSEMPTDFHGIHDDISTYQEHVTRLKLDSCKTLPLKVIVFSQFLEHIHVIEKQLTLAGISYGGLYSPMHSFNKMKALTMFQHDASCTVLLMDGIAALGLDLSFVTHVFLMEPIWDRSMEEQVISRAHRMGATRPIHVETLAMRGTIEEQMLDFLQDATASCTILRQDIFRASHEGSRAARTLHDFAESNYLAHLSFVRTCFKI